MPKFAFQAINENGSLISGVLEADSLDTANSLLVNRGYIPSQVKVQSGISGGFSWGKLLEHLNPVKPADLILFTKQFRTLLSAGVPMLKLLQVLETQTDNARLKRVIGALTLDIKEGASLYEAFRKHPATFSPMYCGMVQAGEASGALPEVLDRLTYIIEHEYKVKADIRAALQYPMIVIVFLGVAFFVLLTFVIPKFVTIFLGAGLDLPWPTLVCMRLYEFIDAYSVLLIGGALAGGAALVVYLHSPPGRLVWDTLILRVPVLGPLFQKTAMSRFASIFSILQSSGVAILDSMGILAGTIGNSAIAREFERISERLEEGRGIAEPLRGARYFTPIVINMIAIGEESGNLDLMLGEISVHYDTEVEYAMKKLSDSIGPVLTIGLAVVVGFFALAIFLPMWDLVGVVK